MRWSRGNTRFAALCVAALAAGVAGQQVQVTQAQTAPPSSRGGLMGVPAKLPNVLGRNRSLPIERQITFPAPTLPPLGPGGLAPGPGVIWGGNCWKVGDGLTIRGHLSNDDWKLHFKLRSPDLIECDPPRHPGWGYYSPWWGIRYGSYINTGPVNGYYAGPVDYSLRYPQLAQPQPAAPAAEPAPELTSLEKARLYMAVGALEEAIEAYRDHLDADPEDVEAMRALGVAMLEHGRTEDGIAMVALAYRTDPMLARSKLDLAEIGLDGRRYVSLRDRVLHFAARTDSGSAHLVGTMLLQADDKTPGAIRVLDRAARAGLSDDIVDAFRRELGVPVARL